MRRGRCRHSQPGPYGPAGEGGSGGADLRHQQRGATRDHVQYQGHLLGGGAAAVHRCRPASCQHHLPLLPGLHVQEVLQDVRQGRPQLPAWTLDPSRRVPRLLPAHAGWAVPRRIRPAHTQPHAGGWFPDQLCSWAPIKRGLPQPPAACGGWKRVPGPCHFLPPSRRNLPALRCSLKASSSPAWGNRSCLATDGALAAFLGETEVGWGWGDLTSAWACCLGVAQLGPMSHPAGPEPPGP